MSSNPSASRKLPRIPNPRAAADPVRYMDEVRASPLGRRYKRVALETLELAPGHVVLDVGCGPGDDSRAFAERVGPGGRVVGIDHDPRMIRAARERSAAPGLALELLDTDLFELDAPDRSFDRVYADRVLQLFGRRRERAVREMVRRLRPGGLLVACSPDSRSFTLDVGERELTPRLLGWLGRPGWNGGELPQLLKDAGLVRIRSHACSHLTTDFAEVDASTPLRTLARWARDAGAFDDAELDRWLTHLDAAVAADRFSFGCVVYIVRGERP